MCGSGKIVSVCVGGLYVCVWDDCMCVFGRIVSVCVSSKIVCVCVGGLYICVCVW